MPSPDRHAQKRNWFESILRWIPGFKGYLEKGYRRESDFLARKWMADRLHQAKTGLDDFLNSLLAAGNLDALPQMERVRSRLDGVINSMRGAVRGYSGIFDYVRVREELLDQVYFHDMSLMEDVESLANSMEQLTAKPEEPAAVASALLRHIDEVDRKFAQRGQLLEGLGPDPATGE